MIGSEPEDRISLVVVVEVEVEVRLVIHAETGIKEDFTNDLFRLSTADSRPEEHDVPASACPSFVHENLK
jgi:hypothetical protein